jgi:hypothetical protein
MMGFSFVFLQLLMRIKNHAAGLRAAFLMIFLNTDELTQQKAPFKNHQMQYLYCSPKCAK